MSYKSLVGAGAYRRPGRVINTGLPTFSPTCVSVNIFVPVLRYFLFTIERWCQPPSWAGYKYGAACKARSSTCQASSKIRASRLHFAMQYFKPGVFEFGFKYTSAMQFFWPAVSVSSNCLFSTLLYTTGFCAFLLTAYSLCRQCNQSASSQLLRDEWKNLASHILQRTGFVRQ